VSPPAGIAASHVSAQRRQATTAAAAAAAAAQRADNAAAQRHSARLDTVCIFCMYMY